MAQQKYPISHQDFKKIISEHFVYVDKTHYVHKLAERGGYYFLSRPRRFGKSLLISTLYYLFKGQQDLFDGLYIADKWEFQEYPIIHIPFSKIGYREIGLERALCLILQQQAALYGLSLSAASPSLQLDELIKKLFDQHQQQVVILIDEYDKPIIDYLDADQLHQAQENRDILKSFYSVLKDADAYLKLFFVTGVSKFSQVSIFSDLNNLYDLTMLPEYNEICGISQAELELYFPQELQAYDKAQIKAWYNGYRWDEGCNTVYNPYSLLNFFGSNGKFRNYWYTTGTPSFLMALSRDLGWYDVSNSKLSQTGMNAFSLERLQLVPLLFQTGYLTITGFHDLLKIYQLDYPNQEVKSSYLEGLLEVYSFNPEPTVPVTLSDLLLAIQEKKPEKLKQAINQAFAHIPYPLWQKDNEHFYHAIVHLLFSLLGVYIYSEVCTKDGRADALILFEQDVFCLEFKLDKSAEAALQQITDRGYLTPYANTGKTLHRIGINFSKEHKQVEGLLWETIA